MAYDRYSFFKSNGDIKLVPFISIPKKSTDCYTYYKAGISRMDLLSYKYYGNPNYGWLIMQANPEIGSMEFEIISDIRIRIPYPLESTLVQYSSDIEKYKTLYGID